MSLSCLQHHRLRHCFLLRSYGPNAQLCLYVSCFLKGFLKVLPLITWIILFASRPRHCKPKLLKVDARNLQAATRSCFYAGFAAQRNFAEVIAKGEAQGMVSKFIGIMLGLVFSEYLLQSKRSMMKNHFFQLKVRTSSGARYAAADIEQRLHLGSKLSDVVNNKNDVLALFNLYRDEGYILTEHGGRLCVSIFNLYRDEGYILTEHGGRLSILAALLLI
ncbi:hypothetical protein NC652_008155 [Populus alba x Populus x berolinensis]|nr:hypothetical protein NC652_008155 [Populus alba x Populus x berolinensis]